MKRFFVCILATRKDGPLYVEITNSLQRRVYENKTHAIREFTARYNIDRPVWFEMHNSAEAAILKEKRIKRWRRLWKTELTETTNPEWRDLYETLEPE